MNELDKLAQIEREIGKRMKAPCEMGGWVVSVAMMQPESKTLRIEKFAEKSIISSDSNEALQNALAFSRSEFGTVASVERIDEKIPNTRAPYHLAFPLRVDASKRVQELAA